MELQPYLSFDGTCEEALNFYKGIFKGEIVSLHRFEGSPMAVPDPSKVMHAAFAAGPLRFMASDGMERAASDDPGRVTMSLVDTDEAEARRVFDALAAGGTVRMPFAKQFWGDLFGMLTDKYGIPWMMSCHPAGTA